MSLQAIINQSNSLNINRRKMVGVQYARNELPRTTETPTFNPWKLTVGVPDLVYSRSRSILEGLDTIDRRTPQVISFSDSPNVSWMFRYQGTLNSTQKSSITVSSFVGNQLTLNVSAVSSSPLAVVLEAGDFIQIQGYPYPFTSTTQVLRGLTGTVTVTTHRPNILSNPVSNLNLNWGNDVEFNVFCPNMPTYTLSPGGYIRQGGVVINNALVSFTDNFLLYEYVASA